MFSPESESYASAESAPLAGKRGKKSAPADIEPATALANIASAFSSPSQGSAGSRYDTFGSLTRTSDGSRVGEWLAENQFDTSVVQKLSGYNGVDVLSLSKDDLRALIGTKDGIRLYNRLKQVREALAALGHDQPDSSERHRVATSAQRLFPEGSSGGSSPALSGAGGSGDGEAGWARSRHMQDGGSSRHHRHGHGLGRCEVMRCDKMAIARCSNESCEQPLCSEHGFKDIFTSYHFCPACADAQSYSAKFTQSRLHDVFCKIQ